MQRPWFLLALAPTALALAACSSDAAPTASPTATPTATAAATTSTPAPTLQGTPTPTPTASPTSTATVTPSATATSTPTPLPTIGPVALRPLDAVLDHPVDLFDGFPCAGPCGGSLVVAEQNGRLLHLADGAAYTVLDIRARVNRGGTEEGLLSAAPDPDYAENGYIWLYYSAANPRRSVLSRFTRDPHALRFLPDSELVVLEIPEPYANHNGGAIRFGPDGMLYLGIGDGGSAGDPQGNGQNLGTLLGSIIRIDVSHASAAEPYRIPPDNPFVGTQGARGEIWAYGLRNPWRMAFDALTGELWVADVGQGTTEEVSVAPRGGNLGWNVLEGDRCYQPSTGCDRSGKVAPVGVYRHEGGRCSISGAAAVRGGEVPQIEGAFVYSDFCTGEVWALPLDGSGGPTLIADAQANVSSVIQVGPAVYVLAFGEPLLVLTSP